MGNDHNNDLDDAFDDGDPSDEENDGDDRQRLMRADSRHVSIANTPPSEDRSETPIPPIERRVTQLPLFSEQTQSTTPRALARPTNDGVFANLVAKPERGEQADEKPPVSLISRVSPQMLIGHLVI